MKILLVEDQPLPRQAVQKTLESSGFSVVTAADGKAALGALAGVDLVISDIRMPEMNGIQLLQKIRENHPIPVVLMTAFSEICDAAEAFKIGAAGFLAKPFRREELIKVVKSLFPDSPDPSSVPTIDDFSRMPIDDFICGSEIHFDIYVRLPDDRFVKVAHQGEDLDRERVMAYKEKGLYFLYLKKDDYSRYIGFNLHIGELITKAPAMDKEKKLHLIRHTGETLLQHLRSDGLDEEGYLYSKLFSETSIAILTENPSTLSLLDSLSSSADYLYAHSVAVSFISIMLARTIGWTSHATLFKIAMGGLFHDIGKTELDPALAAKMERCTPAYAPNRNG